MGLGSIVQLVLAGVLATGLFAVGVQVYPKPAPTGAEQKTQPAEKPALSDAPREQEETLRFECKELEWDTEQNRVWARGSGSVRILTRTGALGAVLNRPTTIKVHWDRNMLFNGQWIEFEGNVQWQHGTASLRAEHVQLCLARKLAVNRVKPEKGPVELRDLVSSGSCTLEDSAWTFGKEVFGARLRAPELSFDFHKQTCDASGPGQLHLWKPASPPGKFKVVRVDYKERAYFDLKKDSLTFQKSVEVAQTLADNTAPRMETTKPTEGVFVANAESAKLTLRTNDKNKSLIRLEASGRIAVLSMHEGGSYLGKAEKLVTDLGEWCRFTGKPGDQAMLLIQAEGEPDQKIRASVISLDLRDGSLSVHDSIGPDK